MSLKINKTANNIIKVVGWIVVLIIIILMTKILIWEHNYYDSKSRERRATAPAVITEIASAIKPSEIQPSQHEIDAHQVAADEPRYLSIPRLGLDQLIIAGTSVNAHVLQVPDNIYETAWYAGSSRPGTGSYIVISGLAMGDSGQKGAFSDLDSLEQGDTIKIITGSGDSFTYVVQIVSITDSSNAEQQLIEVQKPIDDKETLVLVTGLKSSAAATYESIAMVQATLQQ